MAATLPAGSGYGARASLSIANRWRASRNASRFFSCGADRCPGTAGLAACGRGWRSRRGVSGVAMASAAAAVTVTASRLPDKADMVRVFGPGVAALPGFGRLLALDEFFVSPSNAGLLLAEGGAMLESLVYYLEDDQGVGGFVREEVPQPRHGVQLHYLSSMSLAGSTAPGNAVSGGGKLVSPSLSHVRGPSTVPKVLTPQTTEGGAVVKVVSGEFGGSSAPAPLHDFILLDVLMRPGSAAQFPVQPNSGILIYVLEGVGLFDSSSQTVSYQNEGHGLWLSPSYLASAGAGTVHVRTHSWSHLRFLLVSATCDVQLL